jgi:hypothetical protein
MKAKLLWLALALVAAVPALHAQVTVELVYQQEQYLADEPFVVGVRIKNFSGRTLHLGQDPDWLKFNIQGNNNYVVPKVGEVPVTGAFEVESASVATRRVDLAPYFQLNRSGHYKVSATVALREIDKLVTTAPRTFDVTAGTKIWEQDFGVPGTGENGKSPEIRKYSVIHTTYKNHPRLYVRLSDPVDPRRVRVFPVGGSLNFSKPEIQVDKHNQLHLLNQYGSKSFNYCVVSPDGELLTHHTYEYTDTTRPVLNLDKKGEIVVTGGARRVTSADIPPPPEPVEEKKEEPKETAPPKTDAPPKP